MRPYFTIALHGSVSKDLQYPDMADIREHGLRSSVGRLRGKGGDYRASQHSKKKRAARRIGNKRARRILKDVDR